MRSSPPLPNTKSAPKPARNSSAPSFESSPPTMVSAPVALKTSTKSAPSPPNSCIEPISVPSSVMLSFSLPPFTVPVLPVRRMISSLPESPVTVARPLPVRMESSPPSPMMVPGPVLPD